MNKKIIFSLLLLFFSNLSYADTPMLEIIKIDRLLAGFCVGFIFTACSSYLLYNAPTYLISLLLLSPLQNPQPVVTFFNIFTIFDKQAEELAQKAFEKNKIPIFLAIIQERKLVLHPYLEKSIESNNVQLFETLFNFCKKEHDQSIIDWQIKNYGWQIKQLIDSAATSNNISIFEILLDHLKKNNQLVIDRIIGDWWSNNTQMTQIILDKLDQNTLNKIFAKKDAVPFLDNQLTNNNNAIVEQFLNIFSSNNEYQIRLWYDAKTNEKNKLADKIADYFKINLSSVEILQYRLFFIGMDIKNNNCTSAIITEAQEVISNPNTPINSRFQSEHGDFHHDTILEIALNSENQPLIDLLVKHPNINPHLKNNYNISVFDRLLNRINMTFINLLMQTKLFDISATHQSCEYISTTDMNARLVEVPILWGLHQINTMTDDKLKNILPLKQLTLEKKIELIESHLNLFASILLTDAQAIYQRFFAITESYIKFCTNWHRELTMSDEHYQAPYNIARNLFHSVQGTCHPTSAQFIAKEKIYHIFLRLTPPPTSDQCLIYFLHQKKSIPLEVIKSILLLNFENNMDRHVAKVGSKNPGYYNTDKKKEIKQNYRTEYVEKVNTLQYVPIK